LATLRQRILLRFDIAAEVCERYGYYPALGQMSKVIAVKLRQRWPEAVHAVPLYPAFNAPNR
jgi:hypothetical protein